MFTATASVKAFTRTLNKNTLSLALTPKINSMATFCGEEEFFAAFIFLD